MSLPVLVVTTVVLGSVYFVMLTLVFGAMSSAPWVPTKKKDRKRLLDSLELKDGITFYDIGCGHAGLLFEALDKNPRIRAVGIELALPPLLHAAWRKWRAAGRYANLRLLWRDFFRQDLSGADILFMFLLPGPYKRVATKLAKELKDDALIVVEAWPLPGIEPLRKIEEKDAMSFYLYEARQLRQGNSS